MKPALLLPLVVLSALAFAAEPHLKVSAVADATLSSNGQGPGGNNPTFRLMAEANEKHRAVILFEFKDNAAKPCTGAVLHLTTDKCWPNTKLQHIRVHRLLRPFDEKSASWINCVHQDQWINPGGDFDPNPIAARRLSKDDNGGGKSIDFDITPLVQGWQSKVWPNYGATHARRWQRQQHPFSCARRRRSQRAAIAFVVRRARAKERRHARAQDA